MPTQEFEVETIIGTVKGVAPEGVMVPSPYSWLLANNIPSLYDRGDTFLDLGAGTGIIAIVAAIQGGQRVFATDTNPAALEATIYNARLNHVEDRVHVLPAGDMFEPVQGLKFDGIFCNPAQLPMAPQPDLPSAYSAGERGRNMIENLIFHGGEYLKPGGGLLFTHTSLINSLRTFQNLWDMGFLPEIRGEMEIPFRSFYDQEWMEKVFQEWCEESKRKAPNLPFLFLQERMFLEQEGLFKKKDGVYTEKVSVIHAAKVEYDRFGEKPNFLHPQGVPLLSR